MSDDKTQPVKILGAGAWGLSTAFHLLHEGYNDITVFDRAPEIPSRYSAGWDINKIVRAEYEDGFYTELALKAIQQWKTPLFGPYFHQTGYVVATSSQAPKKAIDHLQHALASVEKHPAFSSAIRALTGPEDFKDEFWQFTGPMTGFQGYSNRIAGYVHSANAMKGLYEYLAVRGVRFFLGPHRGRVTELMYEGEASSASSRRCIGLRTADGKTHLARRTICCLGAYAASLIPAVGAFSMAKSWSVAHVQLTETECDYLRGIPVLNVRDLGFFFEPDPATRLFKLCPLGGGFVNTDAQTGISLPPPADHQPPQDYIPASDERKLRRLLRETLPWMADRPFVDQKMCWFADTRDSEYVVDFVPGTTDGSLVILTGDSGHGFKMMPIVGEWVVQLLRDGCQKLDRWRWKETEKKNWGAEVSWRVGNTEEIETVIKEKEAMLKARL